LRQRQGVEIVISVAYYVTSSSTTNKRVATGSKICQHTGCTKKVTPFWYLSFLSCCWMHWYLRCKTIFDAPQLCCTAFMVRLSSVVCPCVTDVLGLSFRSYGKTFYTNSSLCIDAFRIQNLGDAVQGKHLQNCSW